MFQDPSRGHHFTLRVANVAQQCSEVHPGVARVPMLPQAATAHLGKREVETLRWVARGKTSAEIAQILGLSKRTVDFHVENARGKLGVATRMQAVAKATAEQIIIP